VEVLKAALAAHKAAEFKLYPGAPHGFHAATARKPPVLS
jgi:carboxymethylenebutenolidase